MPLYAIYIRASRRHSWRLNAIKLALDGAVELAQGLADLSRARTAPNAQWLVRELDTDAQAIPESLPASYDPHAPHTGSAWHGFI